jgi:hypothetical protein
MILAGNGGSASVNGWAAIETSTQDLENVEIVTRLEFELPGRVVMDNGEAPAGLRVIAQIDLNDGWSRNVTTDAKGGFVVKNLVNGKYRLRVDVLPPGVYQAGSAELDLTGGAPSEPLVITLKRSTGEVTGTVSDLAGARAIVTLVPESGRTELLRRVTTDQNGRYVMKDVAPGAYRIYAWNELEPSAEFPKEGTSVVVRDDSHQTIKLRPVR